MDTIHIRGGHRLKGAIPVSGAKNAALPLMTAALLTDEPLRLSNMPRLTDVKTLGKLLAHLGAELAIEPGEHADTTTIRAADIKSTTAPYEIVSQIRASFWVLGPLLARCHQARVSLPGGCAIGARPVDLYIKGLQKMGAEIDLVEGYVVASAPGGLKGAVVRSPVVSVGATHTLLMAATLAEGETVLENAAREPEIGDVARCLVAMGAKISGIGTSTLRIEGVEKLHGASHSVIADRIEAGTYAIAAAMTGGEVTLEGVDPETFDAALFRLLCCGVPRVDTEQGAVRIFRNGERLQATDVVTQVFPGFPTDLQAQFMALMTTADGESRNHRNDFRKPLHACAGAGPFRRRHFAAWRQGAGARRVEAERRARDGERSARPRLPPPSCRPRRRRRNRHQPRLPPRPRLRAHRGQARRPRCRNLA